MQGNWIRRRVGGVVVVIAAGGVLLSAALQAEDWCTSFPAAHVLVGYVNVHATRAVPAVGGMLDGQDRLSRFAAEARQQLALDLESVSEVWFGVTPGHAPLFVMAGRFNLASIRSAVGARGKMRITTPKGAEFAAASVDGGRAGRFSMLALLSPTVLVLGETGEVQEFLANLSGGMKHPHHAALAGFAEPSHMAQFTLLGVPEELRRVPPAVGLSLERIEVGLDATEEVVVGATIVPRDPRLADPLSRWGQSALAILALLPPEQVPLDPAVRCILEQAAVRAADGSVVLSAGLPFPVLRDLLIPVLAVRSGGPAR